MIARPSCYGKPGMVLDCSRCALQTECFRKHSEENSVYLLSHRRTVPRGATQQVGKLMPEHNPPDWEVWRKRNGKES